MKRQDYEKPTMEVVQLHEHGIICSSPGQAGVQDYNWNNVDEE